MIQSTKETAKQMKKAGGKSLRQAADAEALRRRGEVIDGDSEWSPKRRDADELASEIANLKLAATTELVAAPIADVVVTKANPRTLFDQEALDELAASLREHGLLQPIVVREIDSDRKDAHGARWPAYELIAGERRLRAAKQLGWTTIAAIVQPFDDVQAVEARAIENLARENLNAIETAVAYRQMMDATGESQAGLAKRLGCSQPKIAHAVNLLRLPKLWQDRLVAGQVTAFEVRPLLAWATREHILAAAATSYDESKARGWGRSVEEALDEALRQETHGLEGTVYGAYPQPSVKWKIDLAKLDEATRRDLDVAEVDWGHGKPEPRACNRKLAEQLVAAQVEKKRRATKKQEGKVATKEAAAKVEKTPEEIAAAEQVRAEQLRSAVEEWRIQWLRPLVAAAMTLHVARRLFLWSWSNVDTHTLDLPARRELQRRLAGLMPLSTNARFEDDGMWLPATAKILPAALDEIEVATARELVTGDAASRLGRTAIPAGIVNQLAAELNIDEDAAWKWTDDFCRLFRKAELLGLCKEAKCGLADADMSKDDLVRELVEHGYRVRPKLLVSIAKAATKKGGRS